MNLRFLRSLSGVLWVTAGIGITTSTLSPVHALATKLPAQAEELTHQPSANQIAQDNQVPEEGQVLEDDVASLPEAIQESILKDASRQSGVQVSKLRVVKVKRQMWSDGCLGLAGSDGVCNQAQIPGWEVLVANGEKTWVYRCNESGSLVKLDEDATRTIATRSTTIRREVTTSRTTQSTQAASGSASSESTLATGSASSSSSSSTGVVAGSSGMSEGSSMRMRQVTAARSVQVSYSDVSGNYWARDFIVELTRRGILTGFPDGTFRPNEPVTRAQFAALVAAVFKKSKVRDVVSFRDVSSSYWAYNGIREAYEMGFLDAISSSRFSPTQSMTRSQILAAFARGLNYTTISSTAKVLQFYSDAAAIPASYRTLIAAATERGIVANYPNVKTCSPNKVATRAEVAALLYQAMVSTGDAVAISSPHVVSSQVPPSPVQATPTSTVPEPAVETGEGGRKKPHCNQGIGNGAEGCDPGNSHPHGGSNDETGRTPGNRK
jgi:hypothetical protein